MGCSRWEALADTKTTTAKDVQMVREALTSVAKPKSTEWYMDAPQVAENALAAFHRLAELIDHYVPGARR